MTHPVTGLLPAYVEEGIPTHNGTPMLIQALETAIYKGPHASYCTPEMTAFIRWEIHRMIKDRFRILLLASEQ